MAQTLRSSRLNCSKYCTLVVILLFFIVQLNLLGASLDLKSKVTVKSFGRRDSAATSQFTSALAEAKEKNKARNEKLLKEFKDSLPPGSPYKEQIFGNEYVMDTIPFVNETSKAYQERVRKVQIKKNHILVLIPSYRDPDCHNTITNLFERCKFCDRITVGLILQLNFSSDDEWDAKNPCVGEQYRENFHTLYVPSNITRGTVFSRYAASKFWDGEEFVLGIDSHTNFVTHWDEKIIADYKDVPNKVDIPEHKRSYWLDKYIFSTYPAGMDEGKDADLSEDPPYGIPYICKGNFQQGQGNSLQAGLFTQIQIVQPVNKSNLSPSFLIGAGFMFGNYKFLWDVKFDPHAPFIWIGEEVTMNLQLWTRGWNFFRPPRNYITHKYGGEKRGYVYGDLQWAIPMKEDSAQRVAYIIGIRKELPDCVVSTHCLLELEDYSLGKERTMEQWMQWTGINMKTKFQQDRCHQHFDYHKDKWIQDK